MSRVSGVLKRHLNLKFGFVYLDADKSEGVLFLPEERGCGFTVVSFFRLHGDVSMDRKPWSESCTLVGGNTTQNNDVGELDRSGINLSELNIHNLKVIIIFSAENPVFSSYSSAVSHFR